MKRIENAPKELQKVFWDYFEEDFSIYDCSTDVIEHIFLRGFDTAMASGRLPQRPKRTIEHVYHNDKAVFVLSNDKKVFALRMTDAGFQWVRQPDLPQD